MTTNAARHAVQRLQNLGSGADGSTSFFVLAPCVPCILSELLDAPLPSSPVQQQPQKLASRSRKPQQLLQEDELTKPTWLGALTALAYECLEEEQNNTNNMIDADDDDPFSALELLEETRRFWIQQKRDEFWRKRQEQDDEDIAREQQEHDDLVGEYFDDHQQQHTSPTPAKTTSSQFSNHNHLPAAPSEFQKHLDAFSKRHLIKVPESTFTGTDALQLRGGKSSVITWAQREMDKYRRQAAVSKSRIKQLKKQADKILETAEGNQQHQHQNKDDDDDDEGEQGNSGKKDVYEKLYNQNSKVQMLRRLVASKSVLSMQAQSTVPASDKEASLWTHDAPPRGVSAILSVIANDDIEEDEHFDPALAAFLEEHHQELLLLHSNNSGGEHEQKMSSSQYHREKLQKYLTAIAKNKGHKTDNNNNKHSSIMGAISESKESEKQLEQILHERMELLLGSYSPGVLHAETTQPELTATSANDKRQERRRNAQEFQKKRFLGTGDVSKETNTNNNNKSVSSSAATSSNSRPNSSGFRKNTSAITPHEIRTSMVLVHKPPKERQRLHEEYERQMREQEKDQKQKQRNRSASRHFQEEDEIFAETPSVSVIIDPKTGERSYVDDDDNDVSQQENRRRRSLSPIERLSQNRPLSAATPEKNKKVLDQYIWSRPTPKEEYSPTKPLLEIAKERQKKRQQKDTEEFEKISKEQQHTLHKPTLSGGEVLMGKIKRRMKAAHPGMRATHVTVEDEWAAISMAEAIALQQKVKQQQQNIVHGQQQQQLYHGPHPDDLAHWIAVRQLAVLSMQQPPKDDSAVNKKKVVAQKTK